MQKRKAGEKNRGLHWYIDPVSRNRTRCGMRVFYEKIAAGFGSSSACRVCCRRDGCSFHLEFADSGDRTICGVRETFISAGIDRLLDRGAVSAAP